MVSLPTVNARCTVRSPTVTSWLTLSIMQIWGEPTSLVRSTSLALHRPVNDPLRAPICRPSVVGASAWREVVGLVNNRRTCGVAAH
jgi:hypothetical protein